MVKFIINLFRKNPRKKILRIDRKISRLFRKRKALLRRLDKGFVRQEEIKF